MSYQPKKQSTLTLSAANSQGQDTYSTLIVEDLLQGTSDWRDVKDIVRLTIRALTDVAKSQSEAIREIERSLQQKSNRSEVIQQLEQKADLEDVSHSFAEIAASIDNKISYEDLQLILKDFVSKNDLQYSLSSRVSVEEVRSILAQKASINDLNQEITLITGRIEDLQQELTTKIAGQIGSNDIVQLKQLIDQKANLIDVSEALDQKANKSSVSNALHRKANKTDLEEVFAQKREISHLINAMEGVEGKAEYSTIEKLTQLVHNKADKQECAQIWKELKGQREVHSNVIQQQDSQIQNQKDKDREQQTQLIQRQLQEFNSKFSSINSQMQELEKKPGFQDVEQIFQNLKSDLQENLHKIQEESVKGVVVNNEKSFSFAESLKEELLRVREELKREGEERVQTEVGLSQFIKQEVQQIETELLNQTEKIYGELEDLKRQLDDIQAMNLTKKEFAEDKAKTISILDDKVDIQEVQQALNSCQADISARFVEFKQEIKLNLKVVEQDILSLLSKKASIADIGEVIRKKVEPNQIVSAGSTRQSSKEIDLLKVLVDKIAQELESKMSVSEFVSLNQQIKFALDSIQKEIALKSNIKDVCALLDSKANIDDMNKALTEIYKELDLKSAQEEINNIVNDQAIINESLCTENIVGRWTWKSQNLKQGNQVPWESQVINTLPDNFLWEKDRAYIMCVTPGLYQVSFGFFCGKRPTVQLIINGEIAISCDASGSNTKYVSYGNHSSGNIAGMTLNEYLVLPERARVSIVFEGDYGAEGFLGIKRL